MFTSTCHQVRNYSMKRKKWKKRKSPSFCLTKSYSAIFHPLQNSHWTLLMGQSLERSPRRPRSEATLSDHETKRREAVWELFHSEVVYLMSHLLVLKEVRFGWLLKISDQMPTMFRMRFLQLEFSCQIKLHCLTLG